MPDLERLKLLNKLCKTCSRNRVVPKSMNIPDCSEGSVEVQCGGFSSVSQSTYEGRQVAVKVVRMYVADDLDIILGVSLLPTISHLSDRTDQRFCRESVVWKHLRHPNILPLLGVTVNVHRFAMVSEWMENGNINAFIKSHWYVNRGKLVRSHLTLQEPH